MAAPSARLRSAVGVVLLAAGLLALDVLAGLSGASLHGPGSAAVRAAVPAEPGPCVAGWREMPVPNDALRTTPLDVVTYRGRPAWILGGSVKGILALRWDGSAWRRSAKTKGLQGLTAGTALGKRQLLAVGYERPDKIGLRTVSGKIIGSRWKRRPTPRVRGTQRATLADVVRLPRGQALAVGTHLKDGRLRAYALRWTGKRWVSDSPSAGRGSGLVAVTRAPGGTVWAAGWREVSSGTPRPWIGRRARGRWVRVDSPSLPAGTAVIVDIAFRRANEGWAVGYLAERGSDDHTVFLLRWDGRRWRRAALPWADDFAALPHSIAVSSDGTLWISGTQTATEQREMRGFIAHGSRSDWRLDLLAVTESVRSEVHDVTPTVKGAVAVGAVGGTTVILHECAVTGPSAARPRGRVRLATVPARRRVPVEEDGGDEGETVPGPTLTAAAVRVPRAVAPSGFVIRDVSLASGLGQVTKTYQGVAADFDDDGRRDVFIGRHLSGLARLAMGGPDGYSDAPTSAFSRIDRHGCDSADVDRDGRLDLLCAIGASRGKAVKRHELSLAVGTAGRRISRSALGISDPLGRGRQVAFIRVDDDPFPEVFITNAPDREDGLPGYNRFYRNVGGRYVPAPGMGLDASHGGTCAEVRDIEGDGDQDLVYCAGFPFGGRPGGVRIMRNEGGRLRDRTKALGARPIGDIDVAIADVTGDGRPDLIQLRRDRLRVSRWTRRGYRLIYDARISKAKAVAAGDASGDGRADIYIVRAGGRTVNPKDLLLVSRRQGREFTSVRIPQTRGGSADDVMAVDYDDNGLTDFIVLNGRKRPGPVQLLAAYPR